MHSSIDSIAYPPILPYINGHSDSVGRSVHLYLQLSYPGRIPPDRMADPNLQSAPAIWEPQDNRVGLVWFDVPGVGRKLLRVVHLRSYSFFLAFFKLNEKAAVAAQFAKEFQSHMPATKLLLASRRYVDLVCDGADAWFSIDGARENAIRSDN